MIHLYNVRNPLQIKQCRQVENKRVEKDMLGTQSNKGEVPILIFKKLDFAAKITKGEH